jgi:hypothetical protein
MSTRRTAAVSGWLAISFLLRYLQHHSTGIFIAYRLIAAAVFLVLLLVNACLLYTSPSPRDRQKSRMPSSA